MGVGKVRSLESDAKPQLSVSDLRSLEWSLSHRLSMASLQLLFLLLTFTRSFSSGGAEISRKELRIKNEANQETINQLGHSVQSDGIDPSRVVQLSWRPRVFLYKGFLTDEECDQLISSAWGENGKLSTIAGESENLVMKRRLKSSEVYQDMDDDLTTRIERRISAWIFLPNENSTPLQVEHHGLENAEQKYDGFGSKSSISSDEPIMATVVLYLSNVTQGGEILFPKSEIENWSDCKRTDSALKPIKGNAILFFTLNLNASPDDSSSHSRCPILEGEMWSAIKIFHVRPVADQVDPLELVNGECTDEHENCPEWASLGECQKNPQYMIGSPDYYGTCRRSCNAC